VPSHCAETSIKSKVNAMNNAKCESVFIVVNIKVQLAPIKEKVKLAYRDSVLLIRHKGKTVMFFSCYYMEFAV